MTGPGATTLVPAYRESMTGPLVDSPLVSTQWLADHLGADDLVVLDATVLPPAEGRPGYRSGRGAYTESHIPSAVFADLIDELSEPDAPDPFTRRSGDDLARAFGEIGIGNQTTVVVYDTLFGQWAARVWWLLRAAGHDRVAVLDGGLTKWTAENRPVEVGALSLAPAVFTPAERPELWISKDEVRAIVDGEAPGALVCGLPPREFSGAEGARPRLGHIPGSLNVPVGRLLDRETNALKPAEELATTLGTSLAAERVVVYCHGGIAAAADALALTVAGHRNVALYDGSLSEWSRDAEAPLVTATP